MPSKAPSISSSPPCHGFTYHSSPHAITRSPKTNPAPTCAGLCKEGLVNSKLQAEAGF